MFKETDANPPTIEEVQASGLPLGIECHNCGLRREIDKSRLSYRKPDDPIPRCPICGFGLVVVHG